MSIKYLTYEVTHMDRVFKEYALHKINSDLFICLYDSRKFFGVETEMIITAREKLKVGSFSFFPNINQIKDINTPFYELLLKNIDCICENKLNGYLLSLSIPVDMFYKYILPDMEDCTHLHVFK